MNFENVDLRVDANAAAVDFPVRRTVRLVIAVRA